MPPAWLGKAVNIEVSPSQIESFKTETGGAGVTVTVPETVLGEQPPNV